jgi:hypothetical protein
MISVQGLIKTFDLREHPEGGYFRESYRSAGVIPAQALPSRYKGERNFSTAIYFLLPSGTVSRMHRIASDEVWHFYLGGPLELLQISPEGLMEMVLLGQDVEAGQKVQHTVPAGYWFGARAAEGSAYSFVGCTVAPGFDFADFELAGVEGMSDRFPTLAGQFRHFL